MKLVLLALCVGIVGCGEQSREIIETAETFPDVGDTVIVSVIGHGAKVGIVRACYPARKNFVYVRFLDNTCNGWYDPDFERILPYKAEWNRLTKEAESK